MAYFQPLNFKAYKNNLEDLASVCPWEIMLGNGIVLIKGGALCAAYEYIAPDIGSSSALKVASVASLFNSAIMQLGTGWTVQLELQRKQNNKYPLSSFKKTAGTLMENARAKNFTSSQTRFYENHYFLIFTYSLPAEMEGKAANAFYKSNNTKTTSTKKSSKNKELLLSQVADFEQTIEKTVAVLQTAMQVERLDDDGVFTLLHSSVSTDWSPRILPKDWIMFLDKAVTDCDLETSMPLKLGNMYIPIVTVKSFPTETVPALFDALGKADCELRWSTRFMCLNREDASKRVESAVKRFHSSRQSISQLLMESVFHINSDREDSAAVMQENDAATAKAELYTGSLGYGDYLTNIEVFDTNHDRAEEKAKYIMGIVSSLGFSAVEETHNAYQAWKAMMPGNIYADSRSLFCSTTNASHVFPLSSIWSGEHVNGFLKEISGNGAPHLVCETEFGIPFFLNLNVKDVGHTWISGPTGAGKSTLLEALELAFLKYPGAQVIIFDKDRSARGLTMAVGGTYLEPGLDETCFQPFAEIDTPMDQRWATDFVEMLLAEQKVELTPAMRKSIFNTVKLLSTKDVSTRDISSLQQYIDYQNPETHNNDVADGIGPYAIDGQYGNLFDARQANIPITDWTMIEMGTLMNMSDAVVAPALFYLFRECEKRFTGRPTLLVLDEAWIFLKNKIFAAKLVDWLKTLRKKHVFVVFATQEVSDAAESPIGKTIIQQCASKIYLADDQATTNALYKAYRAFGLEDSEIALLADTGSMIKKRDYYYKSAIGSRIFRLGLDRLQLGLLTTSAEDHQMLDKLEAKYGRNSRRELAYNILKAKNIKY